MVSIKGASKLENYFIQDNLNKFTKKKYFNIDNSPTIVKTRFVDKNTNHKMLGVYKVEDKNLRPICKSCNVKMGTQNWNDYDKCI